MGKTLADLDVGAKVKFGKYQVESEEPWDIVWTVVAKNHQCEPAYPENSVTLHAFEILDLRCFDAKEPNSSVSNRVNYGNNRYAVSNMNNWLNSNAAAGNWYSAQHDTDQSPNSSSYVYAGTQHASRPGFLNLFSDDEYNAILTTTIRTAKPITDGESYEDISVKVFLPSKMEVGLGQENSISEGAAWGYYTSDSSRIGYLTQQCYDNTVSSSKPSSKSTDWYWWLRTPYYSDADYARGVRSDGGLGGVSACGGGYGVRPALNLSSSLLVSDETDSDGAYCLVLNTIPTISGSDGYIGAKSDTFTYLYTVSDADGDAVSVTETVDEAVVRTYTPTLDVENTMSIDGDTWLSLESGEHVITITVTDANGGVAVRSLTFRKIVSKTYATLGEWAKDTCDAIREKSGYGDAIPHKEIPERIRAIPVETGSDTSGITATAADVSENVKFLSEDGVLTQGTMPEIAGEEITLTSTNSETTIAEGHHDGTGKVKADYSGLADVSGLDAEAANVRSGKTFIGSSGTKETGSMTEYSNTTAKSIYSNGTWSLTDGYYNNAKVYVSVSSSSGALGVPDISVNSSTGVITATSKVSSSGYISSSSTKDGTLQMTTQSAKTWTPTTENQTISSGTYLTGAQTIKGDSNLIASNIKSGVSIFGVSGTYSGGSSLSWISSSTTATSSVQSIAFSGFSGISADDIKILYLYNDNGNNGEGAIDTYFIDVYNDYYMLKAMYAYSGSYLCSLAYTKALEYYKSGTNLIVRDPSLYFTGDYTVHVGYTS